MTDASSIDIVCYGELLWDMLPSGKVAGGAPFNIVNRANALGMLAKVVSSVGHDELGDELLELVQRKGNTTEFIQRHPILPTSIVRIAVGAGGEPLYDIIHPVAWDDIVVEESIRSLVAASKTFVYSSLGLRDERARETLFNLLPKANIKICDVNLREGHYNKETIMRMIHAADILRMNEVELAMISKWLDLDHLGRKDQMEALGKRFNYQMVIATLGGEGAVCYKDGIWYVQPVFQVQVKDTVGAGDAFLAAFIYQYLEGKSMEDCLRFACAVGGLTASKNGGTPEINISEINDLLLRDH